MEWPPEGVRITHDRNVAAASQHQLVVRIDEASGIYVDPEDLGITPEVTEFFERIEDAGGTPYPVGGAVRDALLGVPTKDLDVEVHGIAFDDLIGAVSAYDPEVVGQWGVVRMDVGDVEVELALPRREHKVGPGHSGFEVDLAPDLTLEEATARRGFRHGALMAEWRTGRVVDLHDGVFHLAHGEMRHTSERFREDPQRVLRGMEQCARFGFAKVHPETVSVCRDMTPKYAELSSSEVWMEWEKMLTRGRWPSCGLRFLREVGWDKHFSALANLEGEDWEATLGAVDRAAEIARREGLSAGKERGRRRRQALVLAAMAHRMTPGSRTDFLTSITPPGKVRREVCALTAGLDYWQNRDGRGIEASTNWLAHHLDGQSLPRWALLAEATGEDPVPALETGERLGVLNGPPAPPVDGNDLQQWGMSPGPQMGEALEALRAARFDQEVMTRDEAHRWFQEEYPDQKEEG
jgi:tRNA nucleotidyltransferase (CCA-adding enzyme)